MYGGRCGIVGGPLYIVLSAKLLMVFHVRRNMFVIGKATLSSHYKQLKVIARNPNKPLSPCKSAISSRSDSICWQHFPLCALAVAASDLYKKV